MRFKYIFIILLMAVVGGVFSLNADYSAFTRTIPEVEELPAMQYIAKRHLQTGR